ncbi:hypothetical protein [uncultured Bartonella sp.]|uniref:capsid assembly protein n=1 Tax=uncultured Bartonella sp. TaxID=104108 RepID=UPI0025E142C4|nr:hypothetical protein [uncultured Bartonella sp.]
MGDTIQLASEETPAVAPEPEAPSRPENVPEKFWDSEKQAINTEALLSSYSQLEKRLGGEPPSEKNPPSTEKTVEPQHQLKSEVVSEANTIDVDALAQEYASLGKISDANYKALEQKGISRELVDEFIQSRQSRAEATRSEVYQSVGGEDAYEKMTAWAAQNWSEKQILAFNSTMDTASPEQWKLAAQALKSSYEAANGVRPRLLSGQAVSNYAGDRFESFAQLLEAQRDPRYQKDPAYRKSIYRKLKNSKI